MKKFLITIFIAIFSICAYAQKDTVLISSNNVRFDIETTLSKTGNVKVEYLVYYKGSYYVTDKTSYTRYNTAMRFGVTPNMAMIIDEKSKAKKIIVL